MLLSAVPPWLLPQPIVDLSLLKRLHSMKNKINVQAYVNTVLHEQYGHFIQIFTDGSKNPENGQTSCAFYVPELKVKVGKRTSNHIVRSIYSRDDGYLTSTSVGRGNTANASGHLL